MVFPTFHRVPYSLRKLPLDINRILHCSRFTLGTLVPKCGSVKARYFVTVPHLGLRELSEALLLANPLESQGCHDASAA